MGIYQPDDPSDTGGITNYTIQYDAYFIYYKNPLFDIGSSFIKTPIIRRVNEFFKKPGRRNMASFNLVY